MNHVCELELVNTELIRSAGLKVAVDGVNSSVELQFPNFLSTGSRGGEGALRAKRSICSQPEPLPAHLVDLSEAVTANGCHLGISVDPDVDRLCFEVRR